MIFWNILKFFKISNYKFYMRNKRNLKMGNCRLVEGYTNLVFYPKENYTCVLTPFKRCG